MPEFDPSAMSLEIETNSGPNPVELNLIDLESNRPVSHAMVWSIFLNAPPSSDSANLVAKSDATGIARFAGTLDRNLRILAPGYIPADRRYTVNSSFTSFTLMRPLHPACYTGYCPGADRAIWVRKGADGPAYEFTSLGLMRTAPKLTDLETREYTGYFLSNSVYWYPAQLPQSKNTAWCTLNTQSPRWPMDGPWVTQINTLNQFRFPGPARMIARDEARKSDEWEFELYN